MAKIKSGEPMETKEQNAYYKQWEGLITKRMVDPSRSKQLKRGRQPGEGSSRAVDENGGGDETTSDEEVRPKTRGKQGGGKKGRQQGQGSIRAVDEAGGGDQTPSDEEVRPKTRAKQGGGKRGRQQGEGSSRAVEETSQGDDTTSDLALSAATAKSLLSMFHSRHTDFTTDARTSPECGDGTKFELSC
ncbi:heat stress transcription factor B-2a-like [Papaver somniferum]|uniref:heat stress transcription factor B-2a-like n=1 Tax=Papaver somniferum TaxID=3469 RepID=UPI000E702DC9|nr:heat stress transcription factor B-2a-like [Papaver somniferum]